MLELDCRVNVWDREVWELGTIKTQRQEIIKQFQKRVNSLNGPFEVANFEWYQEIRIER